MKTLKRVLKPFYTAVALLGVGCLAVIKNGIVVLKIKSQYKNIHKINSCIQKLYSIIFNPYRICNGIRPGFWSEHQCSAADLEKCHELFLKRRQEA